ncbi:MAG: hypothetical protein U1D30_00280 [Planctomycetota bacterium]
MEDVTLHIVFDTSDASAHGANVARQGQPATGPEESSKLDQVEKHEFDAERSAHRQTRQMLDKLTDRVLRLESIVDALLLSRRQRRKAQRTGHN